MTTRPTAADLIVLLGLQPLPLEGGHYAETWRGTELPAPGGPVRHAGSAIYFLVTPAGFSALHRLATDEVFHYYAGDPVEQLVLHPDGSGEVRVLGADLAAGQRPQWVVPGGAWQGSRLASGGEFGWALLGTTMAPGYHPGEYEHGDRAVLTAAYPRWSADIASLARETGDAAR